MRGNAVPANYIKRHGVLLVRASRPTTLTLCARLKATRLWSYGAKFPLVVEKSYRLDKCLDVFVTLRPTSPLVNTISSEFVAVYSDLTYLTRYRYFGT